MRQQRTTNITTFFIVTFDGGIVSGAAFRASMEWILGHPRNPALGKILFVLFVVVSVFAAAPRCQKLIETRCAD